MSSSYAETSPSSSSVSSSHPLGDYATHLCHSEGGAESQRLRSGATIRPSLEKPAFTRNAHSSGGQVVCVFVCVCVTSCHCLRTHTRHITPVCTQPPPPPAGGGVCASGDSDRGGAEGGASVAAWQRSPCKRCSTHAPTHTQTHTDVLAACCNHAQPHQAAASLHHQPGAQSKFTQASLNPSAFSLRLCR